MTKIGLFFGTDTGATPGIAMMTAQSLVTSIAGKAFYICSAEVPELI